jgi:radical SAM superfamily enzyme YgiQ (UPF0313 family)
MKATIAFSDLMHMGHSCNGMPYGVSLVAAYALKHLGDRIDARLFKFVEDLADLVEEHPPEIVCFSNYIWNTDLSCSVARDIREKNPATIIIFGGPNYPLEADEQEAYLRAHPYIDFYIFKDGEEAFLALIEALLESGLDAGKVRKKKLRLPNCHYLSGEEFVAGDLLPVIANIEDIPSPYLMGLLDGFFEKRLVPLTQTTRGCPFKCTFCQDGDLYASRVKRYSPERISEEMEYIAQRSKVPELHWGDLNFGMYKQDLETCRTLARLRDKYGWPQNLDINGKNQKDRVLEAARIIDGPDLSGGAVTLSTAVQSTDPDVLRHVKRENVSTTAMIEVALENRAENFNSFSEVILCLPGDTKKAHFKTIFDLMECDINVIRSHQFIMLFGSESATNWSRENYALVTRFRVTPRTMAPYELFGRATYAPEIDEICVANNTMPFEDYIECRLFNLTVEIFYNYGIFQELMIHLRRHGVSIPDFILNIHNRILSKTYPLADIYDGFMRETKELFETREELEDFLNQPGVKEKYLQGELGNNEQMMYRALAVFKHMDILHDTAFCAGREMLEQKSNLDEQEENYLQELATFSLLRKKDVLSVDEGIRETFHFDFDGLQSCRFDADPLSFYRPNGINIEFDHSERQKKLIKDYVKVYGLDNYGLGNILGTQSNVNNFYRRVAAG